MDLRLVPLALSSWVSAAVVLALATAFDVTYAVVVCGLLAVVTIALLTRWSFDGIALAVVGIVVGISFSVLRVLPLLTGPLHQFAADRAVATLTGVIVGDPVTFERKGALDWSATESVVVPVRVDSVSARSHLVRCRLPVSVFATGTTARLFSHLTVGTRVVVQGRLAPAQPGRNVAATMTALSLNVVQAPPRYQQAAHVTRASLRQVLRDMPSAGQQLVPGLALGDSSAMTSALTQDMRTSGLSHLIAVSGANVSLLIVGVGALLRRRSRRVQATVSVIVLVTFVVLVRPQPSVVRAAAMGLVGIYAMVTRFRVSAIPALCAAIVALIVIDPWLATSYGFALSVLATLGLVMFSRNVTVALDRIVAQRVPQWVIEGLAITLCAQLAVLPITVALGSSVTVASLPANMLAVPLSAPAMVCGLVAALLSVVWPALAHVVAWGAVIPAVAISRIAHWAAHWDGAVLRWPTGVVGVLLATALVGFLVHAGYLWRRMTVPGRSVIATTVAGVLVLLWQQPDLSLKPWPPADWVMVSCDVGQGDATVLRVSRDSAIVIDVGPEPQSINRCLSDLHIRTISLLVLTHFHADHVGGIAGAIGRRSIGQVWVSPLEEPALTAGFVAQQFAPRHIVQHVMTYSEQTTIGALSIECVWPQRVIRGQGSDANNASVVLLVHVGGNTILLAADVEPPAQEAIVKAVGAMNVDILKVPHHGSPHQSVQFAQAVHPHDAIISVGINNDYGHPALSTIALYQNLGARVWRTDRDGDIAVVRSQGHLVVSAR